MMRAIENHQVWPLFWLCLLDQLFRLSELTQVNVLKFAGSEEKAEVLADNHSWSESEAKYW